VRDLALFCQNQYDRVPFSCAKFLILFCANRKFLKAGEAFAALLLVEKLHAFID
jgi:hypothetical protein